MATYYIGADLHCNNTELAIENRGKVVRRYSVPTTIRAIGEVSDSLSGKKHLVFEEGPRMKALLNSCGFSGLAMMRPQHSQQ